MVLVVAVLGTSAVVEVTIVVIFNILNLPKKKKHQVHKMQNKYKVHFALCETLIPFESFVGEHIVTFYRPRPERKQK